MAIFFLFSFLSAAVGKRFPNDRACNCILSVTCVGFKHVVSSEARKTEVLN